VYEPDDAGAVVARASEATYSEGSVEALMGVNRAIASLTGQLCALKPEISLLIELYIAHSQSRAVEASGLGLQSGMSRTTVIRGLRYLEKQGWVHNADKPLSQPVLTPFIISKLDEIFRKEDG
jgi:hypothetical protein